MDVTHLIATAAVGLAAQLVPPLQQEDPYAPPVNIRPDLGLRVTPKNDFFKPFRFTTSGRLQTNGVDETIACNGTVRIRIRKSNPTVAKASTQIQPDCTYTRTLTISTRRLSERAKLGGTVRVTARFGGNDFLQPDASSQRKATYGDG